uniref:Uncharacterized protein n=1 Tax=Arion vulgaris TaxID=1028688 RepID=A0A0B6XX58_9EUPU
MAKKMALASSHFQEFVETALPQVTRGKGGRRKGKFNKRSDGSFSDSSNSFIRQQIHFFHEKCCVRMMMIPLSVVDVEV